MKSQNLIIFIILLIVAAGGGFFVGMKYQQSQTRNTFAAQFGNRAGNGDRQFFMGGPNNGTPGTGQMRRFGGGQTLGDIISSDSKSITVKLQDGSSKIILLSDTTNINKASEGTKSDLTIGTRVAVFGQANSDGSITAQNIQVNPVMRQPQTSLTPAPTK